MSEWNTSEHLYLAAIFGRCAKDKAEKLEKPGRNYRYKKNNLSLSNREMHSVGISALSWPLR